MVKPSRNSKDLRRIRILALDAGGVKCLSSLRLLEELMKELSSLETLAKPCDHFDLICGTQWGGVLAIMLGRLRMSIKDCKEWLSEINWNGDFSLTRVLPFQRGFHSNYFERVFKDLVKQKCSGNQDTLFHRHEDDFDSSCKTAVLAFDTHGKSVPTLFRSYFESKQKYRCEIPIWQIAMATISDPVVMLPVLLKNSKDPEPKEFVDASIIGYSNPSRGALNEGKSIFGEKSIKAVINIGTGDRAQTTTPDRLGSWFPTIVYLALVPLLYEVSTDPNRVATELERDGIEGRFYARFSVESGLHAVHSMNFTTKSRSAVSSQTETYLTSNPDKVGRIRGWATELIDVSNLVASPVSNNGSGSSSQPQSSSGLLGLSDSRTMRQESVQLATQRWLKEFDDIVRPLFSEQSEDSKIKVAILDTGIDSTHPFMRDSQDRLKYFKYRDFTKEQPNENDPPIDNCGHGTHIAGIILKIAPDVELYIARVFESRNLGAREATSAAQAIKYATETWNVDIISMSFGFDADDGALKSLKESVAAAYESNKIMLAAASNDGNKPLQPIAYPAHDPYVFCINSANGDGETSGFNPPAPNRRGKTRRDDNFSILGESIPSCWPESIVTETIIQSSNGEGSRKIESGTSVATAIAAAVVALVMELGQRRKGLIDKHEKLKTYRGIQQVLTLMSGDDEMEGGFNNIRPWYVLRGSLAQAAHLVDKEIKNP